MTVFKYYQSFIFGPVFLAWGSFKRFFPAEKSVYKFPFFIFFTLLRFPSLFSFQVIVYMEDSFIYIFPLKFEIR